MLPAGKTTEQAVEALGGLQEPDDTIIDGGNSFYKDDIRRARQLAENRIRYVDCGTSGVLTAALYARFRSREQHSFGDKMLSAIRFGFGSHVEGQEPIDPEPEAQEPGRPPGVKHAAE
jgi:6-phosphogluconate dehydrogenase (decarboxylating)